jgi:glycerophosphoryl diester phosphodiesterase
MGMIARTAALAVLGVAGALYAVNNSWSARPSGSLEIMAHRGVHHTYHREGLTNETCTAERIFPPEHGLFENTLPSMRAAFEHGADVVEIDVHSTTDGRFAVFHDWTLDCRTEGEGVTREHSMAYLRTLDLGYGYTADGGATFPLRGTGEGMMPDLEEVLDAFPGGRFLIDVKTNDPQEGDRLHAFLQTRPEGDAARLTFMGGDWPLARLRELRPGVRTASRRTMSACAKDYMLLGWSGHVPEVCRNTMVMAPEGWRTILWGWPDRFLQRMQDADTEVWLVGPADMRVRRFQRVDDARSLARVPRGWRGGIDTDRIEVIGPAIRGAAD